MPIRYEGMPKGVSLLELYPGKDVEIFNRMNAVSGIFNDYRKNNFPLFCQTLYSPNSLWLELEGGEGLLYLTEIIRGGSAAGHALFWDRKLRGREQIVHETLIFVFQMLGLQKINAWLPAYTSACIRFADRLGFTREGTIRRWATSDGKLYDMVIMGITPEEAFSAYKPEQSTDSRREEQPVSVAGEPTVAGGADGGVQPEPKPDQQSGNGRSDLGSEGVGSEQHAEDRVVFVGSVESGGSSGSPTVLG